MDHPDKVSGCGVSSESGNLLYRVWGIEYAVIAVLMLIICKQNQVNSP